MGRFPLTLILAFWATFLVQATAAPDWGEVRVAVQPGVGTEELQLGNPLPEKWPTYLGPPDLVFAFHGTGESLHRIIWGSVAKGQLEKGVALMVVGRGEESTIVDLEFRQIRAGVDKENLFLGLPEDTISKRSRSVQKDGTKSFLLPGLAIETSNGKMVALRVHSPSETRWRFQRWRVRAGKAAGPIKLGQKFDSSIFQTIGEPHEKSRDVLIWRADDASQTLKVTLDNRSGKVTRVKGVGLPWRTPNGVTIGDSTEQYKERHPASKSGVGRGVDESLLKLPGLRATFTKDSLTSFDVFPVPSASD